MCIINFILIVIQIIKILNQDEFLFPILTNLLQRNKFFFERYVSLEILNNNTSYNICSEALINTVKNKTTVSDFLNLFFFTGKDINDIGSERECLDRESDYIILGYNHYKDNLFYNKKIDRIKFLSFLYQPINFLGICLHKNCTNFFIEVFFGKN